MYILSYVQLFVTPWTVAFQAPLSMEFSRQEEWNGLPFPTPGNLPNPGIELASPVSPALASRFFTTEPPGKPKHREKIYPRRLPHTVLKVAPNQGQFFP